jgi:hypothetical protein
MRTCVVFGALFVLAGGSLAQPIEVGTGEHLAYLAVNFKDGANYWFSVPFNPGEAADSAWARADELSSLNVTMVPSSYGQFVDGISYDGHGNSGYGGGEDWWHQWERSGIDQPWAMGMGVSSHVLTDGCWDAMVYGSASPPAPYPYAFQVIDYVEGTGAGSYNKPGSALGRPTVDVTDPWYSLPSQPVPVVPVLQPWTPDELVSIGQGGSLTLAFDHRVENDALNPYGLDLIIFGNAHQVIGGGNYWYNGNPNDTIVSGSVASEPGIVSVSQDGQTWYTFANGPYADSFAPTLGRVYDPNNPDKSMGDWNLWWGVPTDPTVPLDPNLTAAGFAGSSLAEMVRAYGQSAGGTAFDIGVFGLPWIQYVRIESPSGSGVVPEVDALADVTGLPPHLGDANKDNVVGIDDLRVLLANWNAASGKTWADGDFTGDGAVRFADLSILAANWNWRVPSPAPVPEPASWLALAAGSTLLLRRRRSSAATPPR